MRKYLEQQIADKEKKFAKEKNNLKYMVEKEIDSDNFELNAINQLLRMMELKTKLEELKSAHQMCVLYDMRKE